MTTAQTLEEKQAEIERLRRLADMNMSALRRAMENLEAIQAGQKQLRYETKTITHEGRGHTPNWAAAEVALDNLRNDGWKVISIETNTVMRHVDGNECVYHYRHVHLEHITIEEPEQTDEAEKDTPADTNVDAADLAQTYIESVGSGITIVPEMTGTNGKEPVPVTVIVEPGPLESVDDYKQRLDDELQAPIQTFFANCARIANRPMLPITVYTGKDS